jgi:cytochrome b561
MQIKNTPAAYGTVSKTLHWLIALAVLGMMVAGSIMGDIPDKFLRFQVYSIHKALGITILALMLARLGWKLYNWNTPASHPTHKAWEQKLSKLVHWGFYALLIIMPLSGWLLTGAAGSTISWFGLMAIPNINTPDQNMRELFGEIHEITGSLIWVALALHIGGTLKHVFIDHDGTLRRMLPVLMFIVFFPLTSLADDTKPIAWDIQRAKSQLIFATTQESAPFKGEFKLFDGTINLNPDAPETGNARIIIDLSSVNSQNKERDEAVQEPDWFDTKNEKGAIYSIHKFEKSQGPNDYIAYGTLKIRGVERKINLPFRLKITEDKNGILTAQAVGQTNIKRLDFNVGQGQWADPAIIGNDILIGVNIMATAKKPD